MTRLLCLGDSYTIGEGVDFAASWPGVVSQRLGLEVEVIARTGWTAADLASALEADVAPADVVTVLIGVNDQYDGVALSEYREHLEEVLDRAVSLAGGDPRRVLGITIPDWSCTPFAADREPAVIRAELDLFNDVFDRRCRARHHPVAELAELSRSLGEMVGPDRLHPSPEAYERWVDEVLESSIKQVIERADK